MAPQSQIVSGVQVSPQVDVGLVELNSFCHWPSSEAWSIYTSQSVLVPPEPGASMH